MSRRGRASRGGAREFRHDDGVDAQDGAHGVDGVLERPILDEEHVVNALRRAEIGGRVFAGDVDAGVDIAVGVRGADDALN